MFVFVTTWAAEDHVATFMMWNSVTPLTKNWSTHATLLTIRSRDDAETLRIGRGVYDTLWSLQPRTTDARHDCTWLLTGLLRVGNVRISEFEAWPHVCFCSQSTTRRSLAQLSSVFTAMADDAAQGYNKLGDSWPFIRLKRSTIAVKSSTDQRDTIAGLSK